jgi:hypothetical protein
VAYQYIYTAKESDRAFIQGESFVWARQVAERRTPLQTSCQIHWSLKLAVLVSPKAEKARFPLTATYPSFPQHDCDTWVELSGAIAMMMLLNITVSNLKVRSCLDWYVSAII